MGVENTGKFVAADKDDVAAAVLLKEIERLLMEGQPRQAIARICDMTGVERELAEQLVGDLQQRLF